jgi:AcrR family transcriptional regulator
VEESWRGAPTARGRRRGVPHRRRDEEVLQAASKIFYERGYADTTIQDVADELGILKGSLYHYIKTKEDLLVGLFDDLHAGIDEVIDEVSAAPGLDPLQRLDLYVRRHVLFNLDNLERISVYYTDLRRVSEGRRNGFVERRKFYERFVTSLIRDAQDAGLADPSLDAEMLSNCVFATIIWTYRWYRPDGRASAAEIAEQCAEFVVGGVVEGALSAPPA